VIYDWLVVGAGLTGATLAERLATQAGRRVLVIDRRRHVGGNAFDAPDDQGTLVHRYGAHIFHTSSARVVRYLSGFTTWRPYEHRVLAEVDGQLVPVPFNLTALERLAPPGQAVRMTDALVAAYGADARVPVLNLLDHADPLVRAAGELAYEKVFLHYTAKQWNRRPEELERAVTGRVPVVVGRDDRYFTDTFQAIPTDGYTAMVTRMLGQPGITVATDTPYEQLCGSAVRWRRVIFTGPIDSFFDHCFGALPYRSLRFEHERVEGGRVQPVAVVNHPNDHDYTRVLEHAHFGPDRPLAATTLTREYPLPHVPGVTEPYYPVPCEESRVAYERYRAAAAGLTEPVVFAGRLARYRYFDMDQAVNQALVAFRGLRDRDGAVAAGRR